jgi:hypothetical protein
MGSRFKKAVKARIDQAGGSWEGAVRFVRAQGEGTRQGGSPPPAGPRSVPEMLALLQAPSTFELVVGRMPAVAAGANLALVQKQADDLARNPRYYAKSGGADYTVSLDEHNKLIAAGALDDREGQMIRSNRFVGPLEGTTFSDRCKTCDRWIWCGNAPRESECVCGHRYRVAFDLIELFAWNKQQDPRCADCGVRFGLQPVDAGHSPWRNLNEWQMQCFKCHSMDVIAKAVQARHFLRSELRHARDRWVLQYDNPKREALRADSFGGLLAQIVTKGWAPAAELNELFTDLCRRAKVSPF